MWSDDQREAARTLLAQLQSYRLRVVLTPAPDPRHAGHMVRTVTEENCDWYRDLCAEYVRPNGKTRIDRHKVERALQRIINNKKPHNGSNYIDRLLPYIESELHVPF